MSNIFEECLDIVDTIKLYDPKDFVPQLIGAYLVQYKSGNWWVREARSVESLEIFKDFLTHHKENHIMKVAFLKKEVS